MRSIVRIIVVVVAVIVFAGGLIWGFLAGRKEQSAEAQADAPMQAPSRVASQNGETVLAFDAAAQQTNGIVTGALIHNRQGVDVQATGVVLQLQPLLDLKTSYNTASTDLAKARAAANASLAEYERLRQLNQDGKNASDKAVEAARAASENDAALIRNAEQSLTILKSSTRLHWGPVIANWLEQDSPQLDTLLAQRTFLLQVTSASSGSFTAPQQATVQYADGTHSSARHISVLPQLDPRLQAPSLLYSVAAHPGLIPGINLAVFLPSGPEQNGWLVPNGAVVWWQGKAWCYVEKSPGKFTRRAVATSNPVANGWFVTEGIDPNARVVTTGAQTLLSEEFRSQIQADQD
jgi:membrane fusion protein, multidrug efflux system